MRFWILAAVLIGACGTTSEPDAETSRRDVYLESLCRLYSEDACVTSQDNTCGGSFSFDSLSDCTFFMRFAISECDGVEQAMENNADVDACIAALDSLDCATDEICDGNQEFVAGGASCITVDALIDSFCPEDSGM